MSSLLIMTCWKLNLSALHWDWIDSVGYQISPVKISIIISSQLHRHSSHFLYPSHVDTVCRPLLFLQYCVWNVYSVKLWFVLRLPPFIISMKILLYLDWLLFWWIYILQIMYSHVVLKLKSINSINLNWCRTHCTRH